MYKNMTTDDIKEKYKGFSLQELTTSIEEDTTILEMSMMNTLDVIDALAEIKTSGPNMRQLKLGFEKLNYLKHSVPELNDFLIEYRISFEEEAVNQTKKDEDKSKSEKEEDKKGFFGSIWAFIKKMFSKVGGFFRMIGEKIGLVEKKTEEELKKAEGELKDIKSNVAKDMDSTNNANSGRGGSIIVYDLDRPAVKKEIAEKLALQLVLNNNEFRFDHWDNFVKHQELAVDILVEYAGLLSRISGDDYGFHEWLTDVSRVNPSIFKEYRDRINEIGQAPDGVLAVMVTAVTPTKAFGLQYNKETGNVTCNFFDTQTDDAIAKLRESPDKIKISNEFGRSDYVLPMIKQAEDIISRSRKNSNKISEWNKRLDECFNRIENEFKKGDHNREYILKKQLKDLQKAVTKSKGGTVDKIIGAAMKPVNWVKGFFTSKDPEQDIEITQEAIVKIVEGTDITGLTPEEKLKVDFLTKDYATNFTKALKVLTEFKGKVTSTLNTGISIHARSYTSIIKEITKPETKKEEPKEATNDKEAEAKKAAEATADAVKPEGKEDDNVNKSNESYSVFDSSYTRRHPVDNYFYEELKAQDKFNRDFDRMLAVTIEQMNIRFDIISELHVIQNPNSTWKDKTIAHERLDRFQVVVPELAGIRVTYGISIENYSISTEGVWDSIKNFFKAIWNYIKRIGYALVNKSMDVEKKIEKSAEEVKKVADETQAKPDVDGKALDDANQATDTAEKIEKAIQEGEAAGDDMKTAEPPHPDVTLGKDGDAEEKPAADTSTPEPTTTTTEPPKTNEPPKTEEEAVQQANAETKQELTKDDYIKIANDLLSKGRGSKTKIAKLKAKMLAIRPLELYLVMYHGNKVDDFGEDLNEILNDGCVKFTRVLNDILLTFKALVNIADTGNHLSTTHIAGAGNDNVLNMTPQQQRMIGNINSHGEDFGYDPHKDKLSAIAVTGLFRDSAGIIFAPSYKTTQGVETGKTNNFMLQYKRVQMSDKDIITRKDKIGIPYLGWTKVKSNPKSAYVKLANKMEKQFNETKGRIKTFSEKNVELVNSMVKVLESQIDNHIEYVGKPRNDRDKVEIRLVNNIKKAATDMLKFGATVTKDQEEWVTTYVTAHVELMKDLAGIFPSHSTCARAKKQNKV